MTHVTCRLTAKNRDQLRNPTLGIRVWATFFILTQNSPEKGPLNGCVCVCRCVWVDLEGDVGVVVHSEYFRFVYQRQCVNELTILRQSVVRRRVVDSCHKTALHSASSLGPKRGTARIRCRAPRCGPMPPQAGCRRPGCVRTAAAIRYDTSCYFNVRSKADMSQLNPLHGNDNL